LIKTKVAFLEIRIFSSQLEHFKYFSNSSDWLDKSRPSKKGTFVLTCTQANIKTLTSEKLLTTEKVFQMLALA